MLKKIKQYILLWGTSIFSMSFRNYTSHQENEYEWHIYKTAQNFEMYENIVILTNLLMVYLPNFFGL